MRIEKTAKDIKNYYKPFSYFDSAREAFRYLLERYTRDDECELLLPAYIGYSSREGSGIYDPVIDSKIKHTFYKVDKHLQIDQKDLSRLLQVEGKKIVLIVHYFGLPDTKIDEIIDICNKYGADIIEDAAHAMFTDFIDHKCGCYGDYVFYSVHKMLPFNRGGMLKINRGSGYSISAESDLEVFNYDLYGVSKIRKRNAKVWNECIISSELYPREIEPLTKFRDDITYQTFPVVIKDDKRDKLYFGLNEKGYGAVSLYHEMIQPISDRNFPESNWLSNHILNLPVHQDVDECEIHRMLNCIIEICMEDGQ